MSTMIGRTARKKLLVILVGILETFLPHSAPNFCLLESQSLTGTGHRCWNNPWVYRCRNYSYARLHTASLYCKTNNCSLQFCITLCTSCQNHPTRCVTLAFPVLFLVVNRCTPSHVSPIFWNMKFHYRVHRGMELVLILSQTKPVHITPF